MFAVLYGGYPIEINPSKMNQYLNYDNYHDRSKFNWGMYHEVGHGHQQDWWNIIGECTVNWFSIVMSLV